MSILKRLLIFFSLLIPMVLTAQDREPVEVVVQSGHYDEIRAMCFSHDRKYLATCGKDNKVIVWDLIAGRMYRELLLHGHWVNSVQFSPDDKYLVSGGASRESRLVVWDWRTGEPLWEKEKAIGTHIDLIKFYPDGSKFVAAGHRELWVFDTQTGEKLWGDEGRGSYNNLRIKHRVDDVVFTKDGKHLAYCFKDFVHYCDAETGEVLIEIPTEEVRGHEDQLVFGKGEKSIITLSTYRNSAEWDLKTGELMRTFEVEGKGHPCPCDVDEDKKLFYAACSNMVSYNYETFEETNRMKRDWINWIEAFALSPDGKAFAIAGTDKERNFSIMIYSTRNFAVLKTLRGYPGAIISLDFNPMGDQLAVGSTKQFARVWDFASARGFANFEEKVIGKGDPYSTVRFSADGKRLLQATQFRTNLWEIMSTKWVGNLDHGAKTKDIMAVSPKGGFFVTGQGGPVIYDAVSLEERYKLERPHLMMRCVVLNHDGSMLFAGGHKEIKRWKTETFEELDPIEADGYAWRIAFSPDNKTMVTQENHDLFVRNVETGEYIMELPEKGESPQFSPDGKWLASAQDKDILIWSTETWRLISRLKGHADEVNTVVFSRDNRLLASGSDDTSVKLWDVQDGRLIATLIALDKEDFIIITPDNYYMTSKGGVNGVAFRKGTKLFPFEQFDLHFNRPDIVLERLGYASQEVIDAYKRSYLKRLQKTGFNESDLKLDFHMPDLYIDNKEELGFETGDGEIELNLRAADEKYTLDRVNVWVNDVPVYGTDGISIKGNKHEYSKKLPVELLAGDNRVQISVLNSNGVESLRESIEITYNAPGAKPNLYLVAIGASKFEQSAYDLTYASKDAKDFAATFTNSPAFNSVKSKVLVDEDVTREKVLNLRSFLEEAGTHDIVLVFVAGHGLLDENFDYYFATHDMKFNDPAKRGIEYLELEGLLDGLKAIRKILIMDTCHSGEVEKDEVEADNEIVVEEGAVVFRNVGTGIRQRDGLGARNTSDLMKELFTDLRRGTGATVISSAGGAEFAMESAEWQNGLFTYCLLKSLQERAADLDGSGAVQLSELQQHVTQEVTKLSAGRQVPTCRMENISLDYPVW